MPPVLCFSNVGLWANQPTKYPKAKRGSHALHQTLTLLSNWVTADCTYTAAIQIAFCGLLRDLPDRAGILTGAKLRCVFHSLGTTRYPRVLES